MPNTASYVAVEHKLYQTFQMFLFAVFVLDECTARTWLPSLGLLLGHFCVGRRGEVRNFVLPETFFGCAPDASPFIIVAGSSGATACILWLLLKCCVAAAAGGS